MFETDTLCSNYFIRTSLRFEQSTARDQCYKNICDQTPQKLYYQHIVMRYRMFL